MKKILPFIFTILVVFLIACQPSQKNTSTQNQIPNTTTNTRVNIDKSTTSPTNTESTTPTTGKSTDIIDKDLNSQDIDSLDKSIRDLDKI